MTDFLKYFLKLELCRPAFRSYEPEESSLKELHVEKAKPAQSKRAMIFVLYVKFCCFSVEENIQEHLAAGRDISIVDEIVRNISKSILSQKNV